MRSLWVRHETLGLATAACLCLLDVGLANPLFFVGSGVAPQSLNARVVSIDEKTRVISTIQWVKVADPRAPGLVPSEIADMVAKSLERAAEIRRSARTMKELQVAASYEKLARLLRLIREKEMMVIVPSSAWIARPVRDDLSKVPLEARVLATGIARNINIRGQMGTITLTGDLIDVSRAVGPILPPPPRPVAGESKDSTSGVPTPGTPAGSNPPAGAGGSVPISRALASVIGKVVSVRPLSIQLGSGAIVTLVAEGSANIGYQHDMDIALSALKQSEWVEIVGLLNPRNEFVAQGIRVATRTPFGPTGVDFSKISSVAPR